MFLEDTQDEPLSQTSDNSVFDSETLVIPESQENQYHGEIGSFFKSLPWRNWKFLKSTN